jgi:hypothetical protein
MLNKPLSKRQLGVLLIAGGFVGLLAVIAVDIIDVGREGGIGPAQQIAVGLMITAILVGLTLLPLRNSPA